MATFLLASIAWLATAFDLSGTARDAYHQRDYTASLRMAEAHLRRWPWVRSASLLAARSAARSGLPDRAEIHYRHSGPLGTDDLHDRALGLIRLKDPDRAAEVYRQILSLHPDDPLALKRLAALLMDRSDYKEVLNLAERLIRVPSEEVAGRTLAGISHHVRKDYEQAAHAFERVLQLDPELKSMPLPPSMFWNHLAIDLMAQGRNADARAHLTRGLERANDPALTELLGQTYYHEGAIEQAERCWREALERDPGSADTLLDLGGLELKRGRSSEAIALLTRVSKLSPGSIEALHNLGLAYKMAGETANADRYLRRASELREAKAPGRRSGTSTAKPPERADHASESGR